MKYRSQATTEDAHVQDAFPGIADAEALGRAFYGPALLGDCVGRIWSPERLRWE